MTYIERIRQSAAQYDSCTDPALLTSAIEDMRLLLEEPRLSEGNRQDAEALYYSLRAKYYTLLYAGSGYDEEAFTTLETYLKEACGELEGKDYPYTKRICRELLRVATCVQTYMRDAVELVRQVRDEDGLLATPSTELLEVTRIVFGTKLSMLESLGDCSALLGPPPMVMVDFVAIAREDVREVVEWLTVQISEQSQKQTDAFFSEYTKPLEDEEGMTSFEYHPAVKTSAEVAAGTTVLCTPFRDELLLFVRAYAKEMGLRFLTVNAQGFREKNETFIDAVFEVLAREGRSLLVFGLCEYREENRNDLLEALLRYAKGGRTVFPVDHRGDRKLYDDLYGIAKQGEGLTGLDASYRYLLLPSFGEVISELEDKHILSAGDSDFLKKSAAFMGYVGFNRIVSLSAQERPWHDEIAEISDRNEATAALYLKNIPTQAQLLDPAWRDLALRRETEKPKREFDYDIIRTQSRENVRKILEADVSVFAKCGLASRYCTLHGDDVSIWKTLDAEEKSERLTEATRLVAHILHLMYSPEVQVIPKDEWTVKRAGGLCCDGGKLIKYREDCCDDYNWTVKAICHECYHGFQHTLENCGWLPWHWDELGVTANRVHEWSYNNDNYRSIEKGYVVYMIQVMEADARAFEEDCFQQSEAVYNIMDWE